jgi:hypothetical protein
VGGAEGVVDVDIRHRGELLGELVLCRAKLGVFFGSLVLDDFFLIEPQVLQQQDIAGLEALGLCLGVRTDAVIRENDLLAEQFREPCGDRLQGEGIIPRALGAAQVTHENQGAAAVQHVLDRWQGLDDPVIAGDVALVVLRHVEIDAHQDLFALDVDIRYCLFGHKKPFSLIKDY